MEFVPGYGIAREGSGWMVKLFRNQGKILVTLGSGLSAIAFRAVSARELEEAD
jgi:hypothetical protein